MIRTDWLQRRPRRLARDSRTSRRGRCHSGGPAPAAEVLEARVVPSTVSDGGTSTLTIALADNETFGIQSLGSTYQFTLQGTGTFGNGGTASAGDFSGFGTGTLTLQASGIARYDTIHITDAGTTSAATTTSVDLMDSGANSYSTSIAVTLNNTPYASAVQIRKSTFTGSAGLAVTTTGDVALLSGGIATVDGAISLAGNTAGSVAGDLIAVEVEAPISSSTGAITLTGTSGSGSTAAANAGVRLINGGQVSSGSGAVTITGTMGTGSADAAVNIGNTISGADTGVTSVTGDILITGTATAKGRGVLIYNRASISSTGAGADAATITIEGTTGGPAGVVFQSTGTRVTSVDGDVAITGIGGGGGGVEIVSDVVIGSTGAADVTISGTDSGATGNGDSDGVRFGGTGVQVASVDGDIAITGTVSGDDGLQFATSSPSTVTATGAGSILLQGTCTAGGSFGEGVLIGRTQVSTAGGSIQVIGTTSSDRGIWINTSSTFQTTGAGAITFDGKSTGVDNGVLIENSQVSAGAGAVAFTGTGVASSSGVQLTNTPVSTVDGDIQAHGTSNGGNAFGIGGTSALQATGNGQILIDTTGGSLTISVGATISASAGPVVLTAFDSASAGSGVTVNGPVSSATNSVTIRAGDNVSIGSGATINVPAGEFKAIADFGDADPGTGSTVTVLGVLKTTSPGQLLGGPDNDTFTLFPSNSSTAPDSTNFSATGGAGDDFFNVLPAKVTGPVDLIESAGQGNDRVVVNGDNNVADSFVVGDSQTTFGTSTVTYANIELLTASGLGGDDTFGVTPSTTVAMTINGGLPGPPPPGDTLNLQVPAGQTSTVTNNGNGNGVIRTTGGYLDVTYSSIETLVVPPPRVVGFFALYGNGRSFDLLANPARDLPWQVTGIRAFFSQPVDVTAGSLSFAGTGAPTISDIGGSGTNTVTWTFATPATDAALIVTIASGGADGVAGVDDSGALDGDPGSPGPDPFSVALDILYGDVDGDRFVNSRDASMVLSRTRAATVPVPDVFLDVNGDGVVDLADLAIVRGRSGRRL